VPIDAALVERLHRQAEAARWGVPVSAFSAALETSVGKGLAGRDAASRDVERFLTSLHLADLALACACAAGHEGAWEHFVREHRPLLYRSADSLDPSGGARELADALYADLFGMRERDGERRSLFRYFHGRSSLGTWLRAVLAQRHVDRIRNERRTEVLPDDESSGAVPARDVAPDPDRTRLGDLLTAALARVVGLLAPRDRLRLGCYYAQNLTLAEIGRMLHEHEATVSRHLTRTRREIRQQVESRLREAHGLDPAGIAACFATATEDPGVLDLADLLGSPAARKNEIQERSRS